MQTANFLMKLNSTGSSLHRTGVTPAEYLVLRHHHQANSGGHIIVTGDNKSPFTIVGEKRVVAKRDADGKAVEYSPFPPQAELARLKKRYGRKTVASLFPGENPSLPTTFKEVGIDETGNMTQGGAIQLDVEGADGEPDFVVVPAAAAAVAPATDGVSVAPGANAPTHLAIAVGDE